MHRQFVSFVIFFVLFKDDHFFAVRMMHNHFFQSFPRNLFLDAGVTPISLITSENTDNKFLKRNTMMLRYWRNKSNFTSSEKINFLKLQLGRAFYSNLMREDIVYHMDLFHVRIKNSENSPINSDFCRLLKEQLVLNLNFRRRSAFTRCSEF